MKHPDVGIVCDRCGVGTEHFWQYKTIHEEVHVCTDCLGNYIEHLISHGELAPHKLADWAKEGHAP